MPSAPPTRAGSVSTRACIARILTFRMAFPKSARRAGQRCVIRAVPSRTIIIGNAEFCQWQLSLSQFRHRGHQSWCYGHYYRQLRQRHTCRGPAAWVADANLTNHYGFRYWEVGNEEYGTYETDNHTNPHDPYTYATNAATFIQQMKVVDPTIKVGVIVCSPTRPDPGVQRLHRPPGHQFTHRPSLLRLDPGDEHLAAIGRDARLRHRTLLSRRLPVWWRATIRRSWPGRSSPIPGSWAAMASGLRNLITDFFGPGGSNIELLITENNSEEGTVGKQSVSLVNALYYAASGPNRADRIQRARLVGLGRCGAEHWRRPIQRLRLADVWRPWHNDAWKRRGADQPLSAILRGRNGFPLYARW